MPAFPIDVTSDGHQLAGTLTLTPPTPNPAMLLGVDFDLADQTTDLATYPHMAYHRVFGTTLPPHDRGKMATLPPTVTLHVSWKTWDPAALQQWLDGLKRPIYLTYHHEPHGDIDPTLYRTRGEALATACIGHPLVLGHGPIVTRYWLDEGRGDPGAFLYPRATFYGLDPYNDGAPRTVRYRSAGEMFDIGLAAAGRFGLPMVIGELGAERVTTDTTGAGRAQAIRDWIRHLHADNVHATGWWNRGGCRLATDPERATLQTLIDTHAV